jgi:hypothetical protein
MNIDETKISERMQAHKLKTKSFMDALEKLESIVPDSDNDRFLMPYTNRPKSPSRLWKLTDYA